MASRPQSAPRRPRSRPRTPHRSWCAAPASTTCSNVSVELPRDRLIVFTGLSGSGKSSASPSTRSTPRASAATSSRCRPTPASSSGRWTSPTSTSSRGCRRRSRSTRSRPAATPARPSARSPRSTTTCACCTPASASSTARNDGTRLQRQTPQQIVDRILLLPDGTRFQVLAPVVRGRKGEYDTLLEDLAGAGLRAGPDRRRGGRHRRVPEARRAPRPLRAAHDRGGRRPARAARGHRAPAHRLAGDGAAASPTAWPRSRSSPRDGERRDETADVQPAPGVPDVRHAATTSRRRATSRSTRRTARARRATGSARRSRSTPSWSSPTPTCRSTTARSRRGAAPTRSTSRGCSRRSPRTHGIDLDAPWSKLTAKQQKVILARRQGQPHGQVQEPLRPPARSTPRRTRA